jgi:hypothetical protein
MADVAGPVLSPAGPIGAEAMRMPRRSRSWRWSILRAALLAADAVPLFADAGHAASLRDALTNAYRTNPELEAGRAELAPPTSS